MKRILLLSILFALLVCIGIILLINYLHRPELPLSYSHEKNITGVLEIPSLFSPASSEDDYSGSADDGFTSSEYYVGFTNLNTIYDLLTLQAISELSSETAFYLNEHGFGDIHTLTVKEDSIIFDQSYPFFICQLENIEGICLEVRYDVESMRFHFDLLSH